MGLLGVVWGSAIQQRKQAVGVIGDEAVNAQVEQALHIFGIVYSPDVDLHIVFVGGFDKGSGDDLQTAHFFWYLNSRGCGCVEGVQIEAMEEVKRDDFGGVCGGGDIGTAFSKGVDDAAVKGSGEDLIGLVVFFNHAAESIDDVRVFLFDLDVHAGVWECCKDFLEGRDGQAVVAKGKGLAVVGCPMISCIQPLQFGQGEILNRSGPAGGAVDCGVVEDDQDAVLGAADIHFQDISAQFQGMLKGIQGVFRPEVSRAPVGQDLDAWLAKKGMVRGGFVQKGQGQANDNGLAGQDQK